MNRRVLSPLLALAALAAALQAEAQETSTWEQIRKTGVIRLGCVQAEPWYYKDPKTGQWGGLGPGVTKLVAEELKLKWECVETTWGNGVAGLQANQFDMMFGLDATPQRAVSIDFTSGPTMYYAVAVLARKDLKTDRWEDLNKPEVKVAVPLGTSNDVAMTKILTKATFERTKGSPEAIASFASGRADLVGGSSIWLHFQNRALDFKGKVVIPAPAQAATADVGVRKETDKRWRDWLSVAMNYYYIRGITQQVYDEYQASRGMDPALSPPIMKERMNFQ
jgi:polar amino acid transport system substrate-binding protein